MSKAQIKDEDGNLGTAVRICTGLSGDKVDKDVKEMEKSGLKKEIMKLRKGIRKHRDQRGDDRCWLDDNELYGLLPEGNNRDQSLPPKKIFLKSCARYWEERQPAPNYANAQADSKNSRNHIAKLLQNAKSYKNGHSQIARALAMFIVQKGLFHEADAFTKHKLRTSDKRANRSTVL